MLLIFLAAICITFLVAFVLGYGMAWRRRADLNKLAAFALKNVPKIQHFVSPKNPASPKSNYLQPDSTSEGVVAFHNMWRSKWQGP